MSVYGIPPLEKSVEQTWLEKTMASVKVFAKSNCDYSNEGIPYTLIGSFLNCGFFYRHNELMLNCSILYKTRWQSCPRMPFVALHGCCHTPYSCSYRHLRNSFVLVTKLHCLHPCSNYFCLFCSGFFSHIFMNSPAQSEHSI